MVVELDKLKSFRETISQFAFTSPYPATPRRSSCDVSSLTSIESELQSPSAAPKREKTDDDYALRLQTSASKNTSVNVETKISFAAIQPPRSPQTRIRSNRGSPRPAKRKKRYISPDAYAHLEPLSDHMKDGLDVLFCGINPGCKSAKDGHHYAHPTNHFWACLHLSGFTKRRLLASEDGTLPDTYSLGLTNLVERPSSDQSELSKGEMSSGAIRLLKRIAPHRPRILCFVGKDIWLHTEKALLKGAVEILPLAPTTPSVATSHDKNQSSRKQSNGRAAVKKRQPASMFAWDLQPYKLVYSKAAGRIDETLFFVMPSTSARVSRYQMEDKVKIFSRLHRRVDELKAMALDTSAMLTIPAEAINSLPS